MVYTDIVAERDRQEQIGLDKRAKGIDWRSCADPDMEGGDGTRFLVLGEEVGEVANAVLEAGYGELGTQQRADVHLREELIQVAAVAVTRAEAIAARTSMTQPPHVLRPSQLQQAARNRKARTPDPDHPWGFVAAHPPQPASEPEEAPTVSEVPTDIPRNIPDAYEVLDRLAVLAVDARVAWEARVDAAEASVRADETLDAAIHALSRAWADTALLFADAPPSEAERRHEALTYEGPSKSDPLAYYEATQGTSVADIVEAGQQFAEEAVAEARSRKDENRTDGHTLNGYQQRVLATVATYGGNRRAAAGALGIKVIALEQALSRIGDKGLLPADLIPLLPPRFARYAPRADA